MIPAVIVFLYLATILYIGIFAWRSGRTAMAAEDYFLAGRSLGPAVLFTEDVFAFSGYAALSPLLVAALFWTRSTKWGALAVTIWVAAAVLYAPGSPAPSHGTASSPSCP